MIHDQLFLQPQTLQQWSIINCFFQPQTLQNNDTLPSQLYFLKNNFFPNTADITQNTQTGDNVKVFCPMLPDIRKKLFCLRILRLWASALLITEVGYWSEDEYWALVEWNWQEKTEVLWEKPVTVLLFWPQISHGLARDRTRASVSSKSDVDSNQFVVQYRHQSYYIRYTFARALYASQNYKCFFSQTVLPSRYL